MATDLVDSGVAVIASTGALSAARAAKAATTTIPIVSTFGGDPVDDGLVASLNRPGGNVTGVSFLTNALIQKRLELLHEAVPSALSIGHLVNPQNPVGRDQTREAEIAARSLRLRMTTLNASTPIDIDAAFTTLADQKIGALLVAPEPSFVPLGEQLASLAARYAVPAIYPQREFVDAGGLMSYASSTADAYRIAGTYVGRILKGEKPADLPVQQSTRIEMVLNLKTAKALGIEVPTATLLRADEVIE